MMKRLVIAAALLGLLITSRAGSSEGAPLSDRVDAVIVKGAMLPSSMLGSDKSSYRVFSDLGSGLEPIPMQIEERDKNGIILVENGMDKDKLDGRFDARDELVFMARDAGGPLGDEGVPGCSKSAKFTVTDKDTGAAGHVLVALCESPPPLSDRDYVRWDASKNTAVTSRYAFGWRKARVFAYDYFTINNGPDLMDRLKVRCRIGKLGIVYTFSEDDFHHTFVGYTDGPVRVTAKLDNYWSLGPMGKLPLPQYYHFYDMYMTQRSGIDVNMNPLLIGLVINVEIGNDMEIKDPRGFRVCTSSNPECRPIDAPKAELDKLSEQRMEWGGIDGPAGALMIRLVPDKRLGVLVKGLYIYDPKFKAPPEYTVGSSPLISFDLVDWQDVKPDLYWLNFYFYFLDGFTPAEFNRFDRVAVNPLGVEVK